MRLRYWIGSKKAPCADSVLRGTFTLTKLPTSAKCHVCGLGLYVLYINGRRVGDACLDPPFARYDVRTPFREYDVSEYLRNGENECEIMLGGGWYSGQTGDRLGFEFASYRSIPKASLCIFSGRKVLLETDSSWKASQSCIVSDSPRTGEFHDARIQKKWGPVKLVPPPGGKMFKLTSPPIVMQPPVKPVCVETESDGAARYDFGVNLTGTVRLTVKGTAGSKTILRYGERLNKKGEFTQENIDIYMVKGSFQTDTYILGDGGTETWIPSFSYHGFRYVKASIEGDAQIIGLEALPLRSGFKETGFFSCGDKAFGNLLEIIKRSIANNFVGFPSDCPHREKHAWTADAHLVADSTLSFFDAYANLSDFIDGIFDYQRQSGQLPGMASGGGFGWHWEYGPFWDAAPILLADTCRNFTGKWDVFHRHFGKMRKYLDYCNCFENGVPLYGVGEWKQPEGMGMPDARIVCGAVIFRCLEIMRGAAARLNRKRDAVVFAQRAKALEKFLQALAPSTPTEYAALLEYGVAGKEAAAKLNEIMLENGCRAMCGIVGAKLIPRALARFGYIDTAFEMFIQREYPGWQWMCDHGATTLWENWKGDESQDHQMLGDAAAWSVRYLAGVIAGEDGLRQITIKPQFPRKLPSFSWKKEMEEGLLAVSWKRTGGKIKMKVILPKGYTADLAMPDGNMRRLASGMNEFTLQS